MLLAFLIVSAAIISSLFRALTPWAKQYKAEVEQHLSTMLGKTVTIHAMETGWYWFEPVVKLSQVSISDGKQSKVKLSNLLVGINLLSSVWHWQIRPGVLFIDDLHLSLRQTNDGWQIDGMDNYNRPKITWDPATYQPILVWILAQQTIIIKNLSAHLHMQNGTVIPLSQLNLHIANRSGHYNIKGRGILEQATATNFQLLGELSLDPNALNETSGHVFFAIEHLLPAQWQAFTSQSRFNLLGGEGDIQIWTDLAKGQLRNVQAKLRLHNLAWADKETQKQQLIPVLKANLAWQPTAEGWQFTADHLRLRLVDARWPENRLMIRYQKNEQAYFVFVHNILLESLLATSFPWLPAMTPILAIRPHGQFHDTQIQISQDKINSVLTRFSGVGWQAQDKWPGVDNLAGVLHWQPNEGKMELAGEQTILLQKNLPPITFAALDAAFNWQKLSDGLQVNMERFIVNHPNLLLNLRGVLDKISADSSGQLNLTGEFLADNAHRLFQYLPTHYLKPKLAVWLKRDIHRINKIKGDIAIHGALADFPFDKKPGEFLIKNHLTGVDLIFAPNWPLTKDLDVYLRINKRALEADAVHPDLQGVTNVLVNDLGSDREVLLIHTQASTNADKALTYIMNTPLRQKLSALNALKLSGLFDLDFKLEAPLYPENTTILALGDIHFNHNKVDVHHGIGDLELNDLTGSLQFDQQGVSNSDMQALIFNNPTKLAIRSIHKPIPYTEIKVAGKTTIDSLNKSINLPMLSLLHGDLQLDGVLELTDDVNDLDHLRVATSLEGLGIDLPFPFGKTDKTKKPLTLDIDFNPQKAIRLRLNYDNQLSSDLWFAHQKGTFAFQNGTVRLGSGDGKEKNRHGLQLVGTLPYFDLEQWLDTKAKLAYTSSLLDSLNLVDVKLQKAKIWRENYDDLAFKAVKRQEGDWSIHFNQALLAGDLRYRPSSNTLTGKFHRLHLANSSSVANKATDIKAKSTLKPIDLPNLNLHIDSLQFGNLDLGEVSLKGSSKADRWQLNDCKIKSPSYLFTAQGEWKQTDKTNATKLQADLHIDDLATSLQRWKISPAVEAHNGDLHFQGGWPGSFTDFSLAKIAGDVAINFKNGRITNLSPEAEEKLGLGKLLSILSLQTIPRRLKLDFSDLAKGGYSFDYFEGNFTLANGVMTTQDSYIDGPVAYASMKGNLDISKQLYNIDLKISPHIAASLPVVATIAGGPVAGVATWIASKIINQGMQKISGYSYKISGPWKQPLVEEVSFIKKRVTSPVIPSAARDLQQTT